MDSRKLALLILAVVVAGAVTPSLSVLANRSDRPLEKMVIIHWKDEAKGGGGGKPPAADSGEYKLLARGFKWKVTEEIVISTSTDDGVSIADFKAAVTASVAEWERYSKFNLAGETFSTEDGLHWDTNVADGVNEIVFGDYPQDNVIAVTNIWGYFSGPVGTREIKEFDIMMDTDFKWSASGDPACMDLRNILTHELGHGFGLGDLYTTSSYQETMYGYSGNGETSKTDLYNGDIAGIQALYGAP